MPKTSHGPAQIRGGRRHTSKPQPKSKSKHVRKPKTYTEEDMQEACNYADSHTDTSLYAIANMFKIPYETFRGRYKDLHQSAPCAHEDQQLLDHVTETVLADWMEYLSDIGKPLDKEGLLSVVEEMCGTRPSYTWIEAFLGRNPHVVLGKPSGIDPKRAQAFNRKTVQDYFQKLCDILQEHGIPPEHIWNMDEKGCQRGGGRKLQKTKYFVPRGRRPRYKLRSANLELFTLIECISADGKSIPPGFVFAGKEFMPEWFVDDISVATSETGWTDDFLCAEWFKKSFIPSATKHRVSDAPILLIIDGHGSHVTGEMRLLANEHNILLFCLPPHTTHKLQPLDVGVFGGVQTSWLARCAKVLAESGEEMPRADIVKEYLDVRERCFDPETVRKAFRKCGIYPFNSNVFTDVDFAPSENTSTIGHAPSSYPVYNPWFDENGLDIQHEIDIVSSEQGTGGGSGGAEDVCSVERAGESLHTSAAQRREVEVGGEGSGEGSGEVETRLEGHDGDVTEDLDGVTVGQVRFEGAERRATDDEVASISDETTDAPESNTHEILPRLRSQTSQEHRISQMSTPSSSSTPSSMRSLTRSTRGRYRKGPMIERRPKAVIIAENARLEEKSHALEERVKQMEREVKRVEAHGKLMFGENEKLRKRLETKKTKRTTRNLVTEARLLNGREGMAEFEAQEAERAEEERRKSEVKGAREAKENERQQRREQEGHTMRFSGVLTSKPKEDLRDIAWAFGLLGLGFDHRSDYAKKRTVIGLKADLQAFLDSKRNILEVDPRFAGLYKKRARPVDDVATQEPPTQRLRFDFEQSMETDLHLPHSDLQSTAGSSRHLHSHPDSNFGTQSPRHQYPPIAQPSPSSTTRSPLTGHRYSPHSNRIRRFEDTAPLLARPDFMPPPATHFHSELSYPFSSTHRTTQNNYHDPTSYNNTLSSRLTPNMFASQSVEYPPSLVHDPANPFAS